MNRDKSDDEWYFELKSEDAYLDGDWLESLRDLNFDGLMTDENGEERQVHYEYDGLAGYGSNNIAFKVREGEGVFVLKLPRRSWSFASYIKEVPAGFLGDKPIDTARVCRKINRLIGDSMLDQIVEPYHDLYRTVVDNLHSWPAFDQILWESEHASQVMGFAVSTPGTLAKLEQLASGEKCRKSTASWASQTIELLSRQKGNLDPRLRPEALHSNPFYTWAGAQMEGFLSKDTSEADKMLKSSFSSCSPDDQRTYFAQGNIVGHLLTVLQVPRADSFFNILTRTFPGGPTVNFQLEGTTGERQFL
ncbi:MAG: hypothetical protein U0132_09870 [Gemmatimonadaceae bacterium]